MTTQEIINSGDLELYVCGALDSERQREITLLVKSSPEIRDEVQELEEAYSRLALGITNDGNHDVTYDRILNAIGDTGVKRLENATNWFSYIGWAAALLFLAGSAYLYTENRQLDQDLAKSQDIQKVNESQLADMNQLNDQYAATVVVITDPTTIKVPLNGQANFENSTAVAFYNEQRQVTYFDLSGLPEAPEDMTYQLWSLTLDPLTPTSLGTVEKSKSGQQTLIEIPNSNASQAFGITLEPKGGSETPTMERLYTLGVIEKA